VADYQFIRRLVLDHKMSVREVARMFHLSRRTIRAALAWDSSEDVFKYQRRQPPVRPKTGTCIAIIDEWLRADLEVHRKQQHTAKRIWERLREEYGADVAESTIRQVVAQRRAAIAPRAKQAFLMLTFNPGDLAQVDWGEAQVEIDGVMTKVYLFCMRLGYSTAPFLMAFPSMRIECFMTGLIAAFRYFGGIPRHLVYDNLSSAVKRILTGHRRELTTRFQEFVAYYMFGQLRVYRKELGRWSPFTWPRPHGPVPNCVATGPKLVPFHFAEARRWLPPGRHIGLRIRPPRSWRYCSRRSGPFRGRTPRKSRKPGAARSAG